MIRERELGIRATPVVEAPAAKSAKKTTKKAEAEQAETTTDNAEEASK